MRLVAITVLLAAFAGTAAAQSTSTITGLVKDQSGGVVPGAKVAAKEVETGVTFRTTTNPDGYYTIPSLPAADFIVSAELPGFKVASRAPFKLDTASTVRIDLTLAPGDSKQTIQVSGVSPVIQTESPTVGTELSEREFTHMPLQARNTLELLGTVAGVTGLVGAQALYTADEPSGSPVPVNPGQNVVIGGGLAGTTQYLADGMNGTSAGIGRATVTFTTDTVQEMKILTSTFSARYGSTGGGIVSVVTKSGTNEYRGSAFFVNLDPSLQARKFGNLVPPATKRDETGATFGGPVVIPRLYNGRNRTFFFASVEPKYVFNSSQLLQRVYTAAERTGDFRNYWMPNGQAVPLLYQQVQCAPSEASCSQLAPMNRATSTTVYPLFCGNCPPDQVGHVIPQSYIDPVMQKLIDTAPLPNLPSNYDANGDNYVGTNGNTIHDYRWNIKVDEYLSSKDRLAVRYTNIPTQSTSYAVAQAPLPESPISQVSITRNPYLAYTRTITPRIVNEGRLSYTFANYSLVLPYDEMTTNYTKTMFGLPNAASFGMPSFQVLPAFTTGSNGGDGMIYGASYPRQLGNNVEHHYQAADDLTMVMGRHNIQMGVDFLITFQNYKAGNSYGDSCCPTMQINGAATQSGNTTIPTGAGGLVFAQALMGIPSGTYTAGQYVPYYYRWKNYGAYVQDDFKLRPNLTLNLGVRYQYNSPRAEKNDEQAGVNLGNPVPIKNAAGNITSYTLDYVFPGSPANPSNYLYPPHKLTLEPRAGFAWVPDFNWNRERRFVVRGGYGITHLPETGLERGASPVPTLGSIPTVGGYVQWTGTGAQPLTTSVNPQYITRVSSNPWVVASIPNLLSIPANGLLCIGCTPADPRVPSGTAIAFDQHAQLPYLQSWSLTTQYGLSQNWVMSLTYWGKKGTHMYSPAYDANAPNQTEYDALLNAGGNPAQTVPDPYGRVGANGAPILVAQQDLMRPYPTVGDVLVYGMTFSNSSYEAGTIELERRFARGFGARINYTWAKSMDDCVDPDPIGNGTYMTAFEDPLNQKLNKTVSYFDQRHRINLTTSADMPFGKGRLFFPNAGRALNTIIGGWTLNGIGTIHSGQPFTPELGSLNGIPSANVGNELVRPSMVPGVPVINPLWNPSVANSVPYFNPAAFAVPAYGQFGNAARTLDYARTPWMMDFNVSVMKEFYPFENRHRYFQVRGEFFDFLNHPTFSSWDYYSMFSTALPVSLTGTQLAGPVPYLPSATSTSYPVGSRNYILQQNYTADFGELKQGNNGGSRVVQLSARFYF